MRFATLRHGDGTTTAARLAGARFAPVDAADALTALMTGAAVDAGDMGEHRGVEAVAEHRLAVDEVGRPRGGALGGARRHAVGVVGEPVQRHAVAVDEDLAEREQALYEDVGIERPVVFVVDAKLPRDIATITLSYTFFEVGGKGHSVGIASFDDDHIHRLALMAPVSRIMVRQPNVQANAGSFTNGMPMTSSLGCGTWGGNITSENIHLKHYMNTTWVSRPIAEDRPPEEELFGDFYGTPVD